MKTIFAFLFLSIPSLSLACTKAEAVDELYKGLLDQVGNCRILEVEDLQKDWWGKEYYAIKFSCVSDDHPHRIRRIYKDPETGACKFEL